MMKHGLKDRDYLTQFLFSLLIVIGSWLFFQLFSMLTGGLIFNIKMGELGDLLTNLSNQKYVDYLKYIQAMSSIGMFVVSSFIIAFLFSNSPFGFLGLDIKPVLLISVLMLALAIIALPMNNFLGYFNAKLQLPEFLDGVQKYFEHKEEQGEKIMESFLGGATVGGLYVNLLIVAVIPAVGEELFFRGILQNILVRWTGNKHWGVIITGVAFALLHFQFLSLLPRIAQGILLGYLFLWTKSLWYPIMVHFVNNAVAVIFYHYYYQEKLSDGMETIGTPDANISMAAISIIGIGLILYSIKRISGEGQIIET